MWMILQTLGAIGGIIALAVYIIVIRDALTRRGPPHALGAALFPPYYALRDFEHPRKGALLAAGALGFVVLLAGANATALVGPDISAELEGADDFDDFDDFDDGFDAPPPPAP